MVKYATVEYVLILTTYVQTYLEVVYLLFAFSHNYNTCIASIYLFKSTRLSWIFERS